MVEAVVNHVKKIDSTLQIDEGLPGWLKGVSDKPLVVEYEFKNLPVSASQMRNVKYRTRAFVGEGQDAVPWNLLTGMPHDVSDNMHAFIYKALITLLATRNCERKVVENTPRAKAKKARDDSRYYSATTYISIGRITETHRSQGGSRGPTRAHLRRGHVRRQRFGEGRSEVKTIFIPPVFVNADREWIADRKKYKLVA
jgi:hypothetical protein